MKQLFLFTTLIIAVVVIISSCNKREITKDSKPGVALYSCSQAAEFSGVRICFDSLVGDARCPANMQCFWQGYAVIKVSFYEGSNTHHFKMSLWEQPFTHQYFSAVHDTTINGYKISFNELSEISTPPANMKAVFEISR